MRRNNSRTTGSGDGEWPSLETLTGDHLVIVIMKMTMIMTMIIRRIRDQMDDKEVQKRVKMVDTASFSVLTTQVYCDLLIST